ncbi:MAG: tRNA (guanosine(37)-N1)-methyltransferase TrmD [Planctomycetales bacterium]|nr:tRNA (guanosine(37)-N1)-methyltransferase TrmD [Planctomycetales bacterium]
MRFDVLTLFPGMFRGYLGESLLQKAIEAKLVDVRLHDYRQWTDDKHHRVDDRPFGGGPGMVIKVQPVVDCFEQVEREADEPGELILLTPQGRTLDQPLVERLARQPRLTLLCGRYEGFDERVTEILRPTEISIGDYILNGGEVAAMVLIDAVIRLIPGVLGDEQSSRDDSFSTESRWLEFPQYTRPREYRGHEVPDVLLSGDHPAIARWREEQSRQRTQQRRADLLSRPAENQQDGPSTDGLHHPQKNNPS